ncbi:thiamine-phosphate kinase [Silvibacterium acidisoli]|uniref:thiamine-phosphate kinase n=1 Tax=Acidobacteriaceae bacterium ZG23-2 TaxID=2883246 RepID=UPI00406C285C
MTKPLITKNLRSSPNVPKPASGRSKALENPSELDLIRTIRQKAASRDSGVRLGIGDDCAILRPRAGEEMVVTTDFSLEGVHFRRDWHSPESVGHRCLARGLSDLAAMGARPVAAFLSMSLPTKLAGANEGSWLARFLDGMMRLADTHSIPLAGGDTAQSPRMDGAGNPHTPSAAFDIVLIGAVKQGHAFLRSGARAGDVIYVTGSLGGSAAELLQLSKKPRSFSRFRNADENHPHLYPSPRVAVGLKLAASKHRVHSAIDLSDGLSTDLTHLCEESGLAAEIDASALPIHSLADLAEAQKLAPSALQLALNGGEDYELLFTAPKWTPIPRRIAGVGIHPIGQMTALRRGERPQIHLHQPDGHSDTIAPAGWEHFRRK